MVDVVESISDTSQFVSQKIINGETSAIRRIRPDIPGELQILEGIDRDPNRIKWFESRPSAYVPKTKDQLIDFATSDNDHLIYAVSGVDGIVPAEEVGRLQGWILVRPETKTHINDMVLRRYLSEEAARDPIVEIEYARRHDAAPGQMASALRQVAIRLASISLEITDATPFPPKLSVTAFLQDKESQNTASQHVLEASGFEEVGPLWFDDQTQKPDRLFILNWQKLMEIERSKYSR